MVLLVFDAIADGLRVLKIVGGAEVFSCDYAALGRIEVELFVYGFVLLCVAVAWVVLLWCPFNTCNNGKYYLYVLSIITLSLNCVWSFG